MADNYRRYQSRSVKKAERKQTRRNILIWTVIIIGLAAAAVIFVLMFHRNSVEELKKLSYPRKYSEYVDKAAHDYHLEPALIYGVIRTESGFNPEAQSGVGAMGIMQVMPETFDWLMDHRGETGKYTHDDLLNPAVCIDYGSYLLRYFYDYYGTEQAAVAAYNAGFVVGEWLENPEYSPDGKTLTVIPYPETSDYVEKVEDAKDQYIKLYYS